LQLAFGIIDASNSVLVRRESTLASISASAAVHRIANHAVRPSASLTELERVTHAPLKLAPTAAPPVPEQPGIENWNPAPSPYERYKTAVIVIFVGIIALTVMALVPVIFYWRRGSALSPDKDDPSQNADGDGFGDAFVAHEEPKSYRSQRKEKKPSSSGRREGQRNEESTQSAHAGRLAAKLQDQEDSSEDTADQERIRKKTTFLEPIGSLDRGDSAPPSFRLLDKERAMTYASAGSEAADSDFGLSDEQLQALLMKHDAVFQRSMTAGGKSFGSAPTTTSVDDADFGLSDAQIEALLQNRELRERLMTAARSETSSATERKSYKAQRTKKRQSDYSDKERAMTYATAGSEAADSDFGLSDKQLQALLMKHDAVFQRSMTVGGESFGSAPTVNVDDADFGLSDAQIEALLQNRGLRERLMTAARSETSTTTEP
jgi:hypothetical protein